MYYYLLSCYIYLPILVLWRGSACMWVDTCHGVSAEGEDVEVSPSTLWALACWAQRQVSLSTEPCKVSMKFKYPLCVLMIYASALMGFSNSQKKNLCVTLCLKFIFFLVNYCLWGDLKFFIYNLPLNVRLIPPD